MAERSIRNEFPSANDHFEDEQGSPNDQISDVESQPPPISSRQPVLLVSSKFTVIYSLLFLVKGKIIEQYILRTTLQSTG